MVPIATSGGWGFKALGAALDLRRVLAKKAALAGAASMT
jgi:hypothetical protein